MIIQKKLVFAFLSLSFLFACSAKSQQSEELSPNEFSKAIDSKDVQVLDVRTEGEFKTGHLKDALLADWTNQEQFAYRTKGLDKSKPVYTYCLSGGRSGAAAKWLHEKGYQVYNLKGGISAWKKENFPVQSPVAVAQITMNQYMAMIPANEVVLVDFGAEWCPPCKKMNPVIDSLSKAGDVTFKLVKIDGGDQVDITKTLSIDALPTFIVYKNGKETWRKTGIIEAAEIKRSL